MFKTGRFEDKNEIMTSRDRDFGRKYVSGTEKESKRKARDEYIKTQKDAMQKFLKIESTLENERTEEMPGTSLQHSCAIVESTNENQDFQDYISLEHNLEHNLSTGT
ncbi:52 kda repressor of the inhibitor of the protein kinase-like protein, partial [Lasius niger]